MKKLVFLFVAAAAMTFAACDGKKTAEAAAEKIDSAAQVATEAIDSAANAAVDSTKAAADSAKAEVKK